MRHGFPLIAVAAIAAIALADASATSPPVGPNGPITFAGVTLPPTSELWWRKSAAISASGTELAGAYAQTADGDSVASLFIYTPAEAFDAHFDLLKGDVLRMYTAKLDGDQPATITFADGTHAARVARFSYSTSFGANNGPDIEVESKLIAVPLEGGAVFVARVTWPKDTTMGSTSDAGLLTTVSLSPATQPSTAASR